MRDSLIERDGRPYCTIRKLFIRPSNDCRYCAWYECESHPHHVPGLVMTKILTNKPKKKKKDLRKRAKSLIAGQLQAAIKMRREHRMSFKNIGAWFGVNPRMVSKQLKEAMR